MNSQAAKIYLFSLGILVLITVSYFFAPPENFPRDSIARIESGMHLDSLSRKLKEENFVRSSTIFRIAATILGGERNMKAGDYYFERAQSPLRIAWRVARGDYDIETVKVTVPEGFTVGKISALFTERFRFFDNELFMRVAPEGYLFPDTYFIPVTATATSTIRLMRDNFITKVFSLMPAIEGSGKDLEQIIVMASLIEAEMNNQKDREMASDILWKRLKLGMPLQVDSYMWTYENTGLPAKPINNPGLDSIKAALYPTATPYLYFLTGRDGKTYYSKTFEEHVENKRKYLN